jgi:hypothetical protein
MSTDQLQNSIQTADPSAPLCSGRDDEPFYNFKASEMSLGDDAFARAALDLVLELYRRAVV